MQSWERGCFSWDVENWYKKSRAAWTTIKISGALN